MIEGTCPQHRADPVEVGRPTKYRSEYDDQVYKLCLLGATDEQLADFFGVSVQTIHNWTDRSEGFLEARKRGKAEADSTVAESLYHRALGYEHDAVKIMQSDGASFEHPYRKKYPPDTTAAIFWLKNRQPDEWRDRHQHEHSGPDGGPIEFQELSDEELTKRARQLTNRVGALAADGPSTNGKP